jgi:hypothetical protein
LKLTEQAVISRILMTENWHEIPALAMADPATNLAQLEDLVEANCKLSGNSIAL